MNKQLKLISVVLILTLLFFGIQYFNTNQINVIPEENLTAKALLDRAIKISKLDTERGIAELIKLSDLPDYTLYKRDYILARLYEQKKDYDLALAMYERLLGENYPLKERVHFHFADLNAKTGNDKLAVKSFRKLISMFPNSRNVPQALYCLAQAELRLRLIDEALKHLNMLRKKHLHTQFGIAANYYLGEYEYNKQNFSLALDYWRDYLKNSPDGRFVNEISGFMKTFDKEMLKSSDYKLFGDIYFHKKDYKNASEYYKLGNDVGSYYNLGYSLYRIGNKNEAIAYLKKYSKYYPKSENAKYSLLIASNCLPEFLRKSFWKEVQNENPPLAYYAAFKEAVLERSLFEREKRMNAYIKHYPLSEFFYDAVWNIMWQKILDKDFQAAFDIGSESFNVNLNSPFYKDSSRLKIGFWLGKICESKKEYEMAKDFYEKADSVIFDNYYSFRARNRLNLLNGKSDLSWQAERKVSIPDEYFWTIPLVLSDKALKKHYGAAVRELILLHQYSEAIDLIGKSESFSKQITAWLKALNQEYEDSIKTSSGLIHSLNIDTQKPIWELAYPLHYSQYVFSESAKYKDINPFLVFALIRQESLFDSNARSVSDASGLMQLIYPTAKIVSGELGLNLRSKEVLYEPKVNIKIGEQYLNSLVEMFDSPVFAVASYNAGPNAVKRWKQNFPPNDIDLFIENIPYEETKNYVKRVFSNYWTYLYIYT